MTKIEKAKEIKNSINYSKNKIQNCLGKTLKKDSAFGNGYIRDDYIDKYNYKFDTTKHYSSPALYFDCYHGTYGSSSVSFLNNEFYIDCLCKAINNRILDILKDTETIMDEEYKKVLQEAKDEAQAIIEEYNQLNKL